MKNQGIFLTQKGNRRVCQAEDAVDADQLEEMVAGVAQTSQSTLLLKKKKEMREVCRTSPVLAMDLLFEEFDSTCLFCVQKCLLRFH